MLIIKTLRPRHGLGPRSARRVAAMVGLALAVALKRVANVEDEKACLWQWHPSAIYLGKCNEISVEIPRMLSDATDFIKRVVDELSYPRLLQHTRFWQGPRGVTIMLQASVASAELAVDIDIYSDEEVPRALGITDEPAAIVAEPRGYIGGGSISSFYELIGEEETAKHIRNLVNEFYAQLAATDIRVATYTGVRQYVLSNLVAWVKASRNYALDLINSIPLYYNPWTRHIAKDMYALAPMKYKRLAGLVGMRTAVRSISDVILKFLQRYYETSIRTTRTGRQLMLLYPKQHSPPTQTHEEAVNVLKKALNNAFTHASSDAIEEVLRRKGTLEWKDYIEYLTNALKQELAKTT